MHAICYICYTHVVYRFIHFADMELIYVMIVLICSVQCSGQTGKYIDSCYIAPCMQEVSKGKSN